MDATHVLQSFNSQLELPQEVEILHPHLSDKAIVDLINGLEVVNDQIKVSKSRVSMFNRLADAVTGKAKQRQAMINENLAEGLNTASKWLQKHESDFIRVNLALGAIGNKLLETRQGMMKLDSKVDDLKDLLLFFEQTVSKKNSELNDYIQSVDLRENARAQLESELAKWEGGKLSKIPIELRVFTVLDNLRNGRFALFLSKKATPNEKIELRELVQNKLRKRIADDLGQKPENIDYWFNRESLSDWSNTSSLAEKEAIIYLSSWASKRCELTVFAINTILSSQNEGVPGMYNINRWINRSVEEQLARFS